MAPRPRLEGKVAIVTGGASGFGKAICAKFVHEGARVIIADLSEEAGQAVAAELSLSSNSNGPEGSSSQERQERWCRFERADVCSRADWERLLAAALAAHGRLDVVVNNAGASHALGPSHEVPEADFDRCLAVNVRSVFLSWSVLAPYFLGRKGGGGCFVQTASTAGVRPRPRLAWYNTSKAAVINATKSLAVEYAPQQIRFNSVSPALGLTGLTPLWLGADADVAAANQRAYEATIPLGRVVAPADVAAAVCYLASDEAAFVTGVNLEVDGGRCV
ncbi:3-oxoacyl-reductase [Xylariaceae sp. FL0804]|nr:3-oxoacyl-reductase [Xylariaceae sp. FL0804]